MSTISTYGTKSVELTEGNSLLPSTENLGTNTGSVFSGKKLLWICLAAGVALAVACFSAIHQRSPDEAASEALQNRPPFLGPEESGGIKETPTVEIEGKSKKKLTECEDGGYSKRTLKLAYELPFVSLFRDMKGVKKHEASSVIVKDNFAYAACDSSWAISKFDLKLQPFGDNNIQVGDPQREEEDSGYEALFHVDEVFYAVRESIKHGDKTYHAVIEKLALGDEDYEIVEICSAEFEFEGASKGFEGATPIKNLDNELVILGLCEGNHCSEKKKNDAGNGKIVAMKKEVLDDGSCQWSTLRMIDVPKSANFRDYSGMTIDDSGMVAITSQEESQLWVGQLGGQNESGLWDVDAIEFDKDGGKVFDFPKDGNCHTIYCNIEGVHWINKDMIIAVSDKMKSKGKQDFQCFEKDQSVHVFVFP